MLHDDLAPGAKTPERPTQPPAPPPPAAGLLSDRVAAELRAAGYLTSGDVLSDLHMLLGEIAAARTRLERAAATHRMLEVANRYERLARDAGQLTEWLAAFGISRCYANAARIIEAVALDLFAHAKQLADESQSPVRVD